MRKTLLLFALVCTACEGADHGGGFVQDRGRPHAAPDAGEPRPDAGEPTPDAGETASCEAEGGACGSDADCCQGFCTWNFSAYTYGSSECARPQENGAYCDQDAWCQSGHCVEGACAAEAPACVPLQHECGADSECCQGFCSTGGSYYYYGVGECTLPQEDGAFCDQDSWCVSGHCVEGTCTTPTTACVEQEGRCTVGVDTCCDGFCNAPYSVGRCYPRRNDGEYCSGNDECLSGNCGDGTCRAAECQATTAECWSDSECCQGFCTWSGMVYSPGQCALPQPAGSACDEERWCASYVCTEGVCS